MPGKIKSVAQQKFLAMHNPGVLHELSGGHVAKGLPYHVGGGSKPYGGPHGVGQPKKKPGLMNHLFGGAK